MSNLQENQSKNCKIFIFFYIYKKNTPQRIKFVNNFILKRAKKKNRHPDIDILAVL